MTANLKRCFVNTTTRALELLTKTYESIKWVIVEKFAMWCAGHINLTNTVEKNTKY